MIGKIFINSGNGKSGGTTCEGTPRQGVKMAIGTISFFNIITLFFNNIANYSVYPSVFIASIGLSVAALRLRRVTIVIVMSRMAHNAIANTHQYKGV